MNVVPLLRPNCHWRSVPLTWKKSSRSTKNPSPPDAAGRSSPLAIDQRPTQKQIKMQNDPWRIFKKIEALLPKTLQFGSHKCLSHANRDGYAIKSNFSKNSFQFFSLTNERGTFSSSLWEKNSFFEGLCLIKTNGRKQLTSCRLPFNIAATGPGCFISILMSKLVGKRTLWNRKNSFSSAGKSSSNTDLMR